MRYKVLPLMYAANENFQNTIRFSIEFRDAICLDSLSYAVRMVKTRYPYFSVKLVREGEELVLEENDLPFVISEGNKAVCLNSEESNFHLLAFAYRDNIISVDVSHNICDGNGIAPVAKTLSYYYISHRYGDDGIVTDSVRLITDPIQEDEYIYPFPDSPLPEEDGFAYSPKITAPFLFGDELFDRDGAYAYNFQVRQQEMMEYAKPNDGSPVSFVCAMLYKTIMSLFPETEKEVVFHIPHEYRKALNKPLAHDSLVRVFDIKLTAKEKDLPLEIINTMLRGQVILGSDISGDIKAINGLIGLEGYLKTMPYDVKKQTMRSIVAPAIAVNHTFGVSYTGNIPWGGMEKYIRDVHAYAGEQKRSGSFSVEIFTIGDYFSLCMMQTGKNPLFAERLIEIFREYGIECTLTGEERYSLPGFSLT